LADVVIGRGLAEATRCESAGKHAVARDAGMAGFTAAQVLPKFDGSVDVVERDRLPDLVIDAVRRPARIPVFLEGLGCGRYPTDATLQQRNSW
jgi:hypothetical protein